jgi:lipoprotein-anchoring transpeptidase ErfK/SrfK
MLRPLDRELDPMAKGRHTPSPRVRGVVIVSVVAGVLVVLLGGIAFSAYRYEEARANRILPGVSIGGVDVGGMTRAEAIRAVRRGAAPQLDARIIVTVAGLNWTVTPGKLGERAAAVHAVDQALAGDRSMGLFSRFWHRVRNEPVNHRIALRYVGSRGVWSFVDHIAKAVARKPVDADLTTDGARLIRQPASPGRTMKVAAAVAALREALVDRRTAVTLPVSTVQPKVTTSSLGHTIVVRVDQNRLYLYRGFSVEHSWPVATAKPGFTTPEGVWDVWQKGEWPTWYNPAPDGWAKDDPLVIPGGIDNPMGARGLYLSAPGSILIHGTSPIERSSIGHYESHGCIRMLNEDVEQLYPLVSVGTRVLIIGNRPY